MQQSTNLPALKTSLTLLEVKEKARTLFDEFAEIKAGVSELADIVAAKAEYADYFYQAHSSISRGQLNVIFDKESTLRYLHAQYWDKLIKVTDILQLMPADKRNEWQDNIRERKTPDFEPQIVEQTLKGLYAQRGDFFAEKIEGMFKNLSGNHVTNSPMAFRSKMIMENIVSTHYTPTLNYDRVNYIHDLRSVIAKILNQPEPAYDRTRSDLYDMLHNSEYGEWCEFDGGAIEFKLFKKGTAHIRVHDDIALTLNQILATRNPLVIADKSRREKREKAYKPFEFSHDYLSYGVRNILGFILERIQKGESINTRHIEMDEAERKKVVDVLEWLGADKFGLGGKWAFSYDAEPVLRAILRSGRLPERKTHQFYPTPDWLAAEVRALAELEPHHTVLEPSAGHGALVKGHDQNRVLCVEVNEVNVGVLEGLGFRVLHSDFIAYAHGDKNKRAFDRVLMNPPFSNNQAKLHISRAYPFLKEGGVLVAVLPATLKGRTDLIYVPRWTPEPKYEYSEVYEDAFKDAGVAVVLCKITRPKEK